MRQRLQFVAVALASAALGASAITAYRVRTAEPAVAACRSAAASMARLELLFGMGRKDGSEVGEAEWRAFLDAEVTPRFPDGLTVLTGYGQWRGSGGIAKETSRMLVIWHQPATGSDDRIEAIRTAYKRQFGQESVLRVDGLSCVSF